MPQSIGTLRSQTGIVLTRVVVPLWILTGATFKLVERDPRLLPSQIREHATAMGIDLFVLLATLIFIEFVAVIVMFTAARLARSAAIFMLGVFCLVLLNEMRVGNFKSCGCLGNVPVKPWQMLSLDALLLIGVVFFTPRYGERLAESRWKPIATMVMIIAGFAASFGLILPERRGVVEDVSPPVVDGPTNPNANPNPAALPNYFVADGHEKWVGQRWRELQIFQLMRQWPGGMDEGTRHVVFYSRTCEHCEQMFYEDLIGPLGDAVTAVEIPASRTELTAANAWAMPPTQCELLNLPVGSLWMITPPLTLTIKDGIVTCVTEGDHKKCMGLP